MPQPDRQQRPDPVPQPTPYPGTSRIYGPEPRQPWRDNPGDVRNWASGYAKLTHFNNPLIHGLISAGLGYAGARLIRPLAKKLYPEMRSSRFPLAMAMLGGLAGGGLSYMNMPKTAAYSSYSAPISPLLTHSALRPMMQQGAVPPAAGYAMGAVIDAARNRNGYADVKSYAGMADKAMRAVGAYFSPSARMGWAVAGAGAAMATKALGVDKKFEEKFGVPVGRAVQGAGPGLQLMAAGLGMIGS